MSKVGPETEKDLDWINASIQDARDAIEQGDLDEADGHLETAIDAIEQVRARLADRRLN